MGLCLARRRGQEKIVDGLEREQGGGRNSEAEMMEQGTNRRSEFRMRGGERGLSRRVETW